MDQLLYKEMIERLDEYDSKKMLTGKSLFVFGHCEASLTVIDELKRRGLEVLGILDNSKEKIGLTYKDVSVVNPSFVTDKKYNKKETMVLLTTRFYEQMNRQLYKLGFAGKVIKLVDYNTYAEYSLTEETITRKEERIKQGEKILRELKSRYNNAFLIFCPFNALGDTYFCMSYLSEYLKSHGKNDYALCVTSNGCMEVAKLFGAEKIEVLPQNDLDAAVQAVIFYKDKGAYIAHQDRPYVINLHKALYKELIPLEEIYKIGVFGLDNDTKALIPMNWKSYKGLGDIPEGKAAILSPYAKSVTALPTQVWKDIVDDLKNKGCRIYTNVFGDEKPLFGTEPISPAICEIKSVVERAGLFVGIRSGMCDILRTANCRKIALFPDYYYGDTKWKATDMYMLPEFQNIVVGGDFKWQMK